MFPVGTQVAVSETIPAGVEVGSITCAGGATCSNVNFAAGTVTVTIGADSTQVTYANQRTETGSLELCGDRLDNDRDGLVDEGCIGDRAWFDMFRDGKADGIQEADEPGLAGVVFRLFTSDGTLVASTVSDAIGTYYFSNIPAGTYFVSAEPPSGYQPTIANQGGDDTLDSDFFGAGNTTAVFAFPADGSIGYLDAGFALLVE